MGESALTPGPSPKGRGDIESTIYKTTDINKQCERKYA
jgi:hypothetical protein